MRAMLESFWEPSTLWNNCRAFLASVPSRSTFLTECHISFFFFAPLMCNQYNLRHFMGKFMEIINSSTTAFRKGQINTSELPRSPFHFLKPMFPERRHSSQSCYARCNPCFINFMSIIRAVCSLFFSFCNAFPKEQPSLKQPARSGLFLCISLILCQK